MHIANDIVFCRILAVSCRGEEIVYAKLYQTPMKFYSVHTLTLITLIEAA